MSRDLYHILQVGRNATLGDIKAAYKLLALKFHPDMNKNDKNMSEHFKQVNNAYEILSDESQRHVYDLSIGIRRMRHEVNSIYKNKSQGPQAQDNVKYTPSSTSNRPHKPNASTQAFYTNTGPQYGINEEEWRAGHYGSADDDAYVSLRQTRHFTDPLPGEKHAAYFRRRANRERERLRKELEDQGIIIDPTKYATENLRRRREDRRSSSEYSDINAQICTIS